MDEEEKVGENKEDGEKEFKPIKPMDENTLVDKVKSIICEQLGLDKENVNEEDEFIKDLEADSLDMVELLMSFEEEFNLEIPDREAENLKSIGDVCAYIMKKFNR